MLMSKGKAFPLGANFDGDGVNFALFSAHATKVELCIFERAEELKPEFKTQSIQNPEVEVLRVPLPICTDQVWHGYAAGLPPGTLYAYRVYGPFAPEQGLRFNPNKLVLDPYAKQLQGQFIHHQAIYNYDLNSPDEDLSFNQEDSAPYIPKGVVIDEKALFGKPKVEESKTEPVEARSEKNKEERLGSNSALTMSESIIYELHVKGFTARNTHIDETIRGSFSALTEPSVLTYIKELGINCVELLPVQTFVNEPFLLQKKLSNYWGYNSIAFFAPHPAYLASGEIREFRQMVDVFHREGIEVLLDVVFNHTAEGNRLGPTYSFRGIDNTSYYRLQKNNSRYYINETGCGNTLNFSHPRVIQLVMDSLRYWVQVMGVDGFRFDLATILGREDHGFELGAGFFDALGQDPVLAGVKLIAEPWDIGPGGYRLGQFPIGWSEWNDKFRDTIRRFWRSDKGMLPEFARRFHGSSDLFESGGRKPSANIHFITSHDGFTLKDLVSYSCRHNQANGENNRDGHSHNFSANHGIEGDTQNQLILGLRRRQSKNLLASLLLSQGTPMLLAGDEIGHSQQGNNNAYCQDNEISWRDWQQGGWDAELLEFTKELIAVRKKYPFLCHQEFIHTGVESDSCAGFSWFSPQGHPMSSESWHDANAHGLSLAIKGKLDNCIVSSIDDHQNELNQCHNAAMNHEQNESEGKTEVDPTTERAHSHILLLMLNAEPQVVDFTIPELPRVAQWQCLLHSQDETPEVDMDMSCSLLGQSFVLWTAQILE